MKKILTKLSLVILPFLGLFDAGYVSYEIFTDKIPVCAPPFKCAVFLQNDWAFIAGLPLSVYGFIFYSLFLILAITNFLEIKNLGRILKKLATFGFMFATYVSLIMGLIVKAWCLWCLGSVVVLTLLFISSRFIELAPKTEKIEDN